MWRSILRAALSVPSVPDGRSLEPARVSPQDLDEIAADATLDLLEYGAVVVVDWGRREVIHLHELARPSRSD